MAFYLESLRQLFNRYFKKEENEAEQVGKIEAYINVLYKLLIWEEPCLSAFALIVAHMLFWVIFQFEVRLYGVVLLLALLGLAVDAALEGWLRRAGAGVERPAAAEGLREAGRAAVNLIHYLARLRSEHPGTFCIVMCIFFITLSIISGTASGLVLSYVCFLGVAVGSPLLGCLPHTLQQHLKHTLHIISSNEGVLDETELLPTGPEEEAIDDGEDSRTDHTAESCANSFISGVTSMPSYLEAEGSIDGLEEEDLEPGRQLRGLTPSNLSDSSDSEHKDIQFETSHFNRDSSSEEDSNYEQGLSFPEAAAGAASEPRQPSYAQQLSADLLANLGAVGSSLVASVFKPAPVKKSDSDSDFEIINTDEFQTNET